MDPVANKGLRTEKSEKGTIDYNSTSNHLESSLIRSISLAQ